MFLIMFRKYSRGRCTFAPVQSRVIGNNEPTPEYVREIELVQKHKETARAVSFEDPWKTDSYRLMLTVNSSL